MQEKAVQFKKPLAWYSRFKVATRKHGSTPSSKARELSEKWLEAETNQVKSK